MKLRYSTKYNKDIDSPALTVAEANDICEAFSEYVLNPDNVLGHIADGINIVPYVDILAISIIKVTTSDILEVESNHNLKLSEAARAMAVNYI